MQKLFFEKFVELLQIQKTIHDARHYLSSTCITERKHISAKNLIKQAKESEIFVFSEKNEETRALEVIMLDNELDAPFKCFSIEMLNGPLTSPRRDPNDLSLKDEPPVYIDCIFCFETEDPKKFRTFALSRFENSSNYVILEADLHAHVKEFIKRINTEEIGTEFVKKRIKTGTGVNSGFNIRRIVHVTPKKNREKYTQEIKKEIDWSHRWMVRGHWRKTDGIGKDRAGAYVIKGFTWVTEHDKGPDGKPLIKKTRIVEES